jgi:hypothetical protein
MNKPLKFCILRSWLVISNRLGAPKFNAAMSFPFRYVIWVVNDMVKCEI